MISYNCKATSLNSHHAAENMEEGCGYDLWRKMWCCDKYQIEP